MFGLPWARFALTLLAAAALAGCGGCAPTRGAPEGRVPEPVDRAERDRWLGGLAAVDAGAVRLLAPPGREAELRPLAEELSRAAEEMTPRVPVELDRPVVIAVEDDYPSMVRHTGRIGRCVPSDPSWSSPPAGRAAPDLHLVVHPEDSWAYRHAEADWAAWWRSYRRYVLHHAFLARAAMGGVDLFAVGVELERTVGREEDWRRLVEAVRRFDPGPLTYAANWGQGVHEVGFWEVLDAVGVDAYWPLSDDPAAADAALARGAAEVADRLAELAGRTGKPVILTEVGFPARRAAWLRPHEEGGELSPEDQARAYGALLAALQGRPWLRGVFAWKVHTADRPSRAGRADFAFLGRPAEAVVAEYFRRADGGPQTEP